MKYLLVLAVFSCINKSEIEIGIGHVTAAHAQMIPAILSSNIVIKQEVPDRISDINSTKLRKY